MIADIFMAFVIALLLEMLSLSNEYFKQFVIFVSCFTITLVYFVEGCKLNFIGNFDLSVWIMFVIMFDILLMFTIKKILKHIKE